MNFGGEQQTQPTSMSAQAAPGGLDDAQISDWRANNEHVELMHEFVKPSTTEGFDKFLATIDMTPRAKRKLRNFYSLTIHPLLVSGNIPTEADERTLVGIFNVTMAELPLDLTRFDLTSEFHQIVGLVRLHFMNQLQKARKGRTFSALTSNRSEVYQYEGGAVAPARRSAAALFGILGGGR